MAAVTSVPRPAPRSQVKLRSGEWWPCAGFSGGVPVFRWRWAPPSYKTVRQLAAEGLRPADRQDPVGFLAWGPANRPRWAYLYDWHTAVPKRAMTPARWAAVAAMNAALRVCPTCKADVGYRIPRSLGECVDCNSPYGQEEVA